MTKAYVSAISYYLPPDILDNELLNKQFPEWSTEKISSKTGIFERRIAAPDMLSSDMALIAAKQLFEEHNISPSIIDFVLLCTQVPVTFLPATACILQTQLGIPTTAGALDYNLGCTGFIYGLGLAKGLIAAGIARNVLFITAETFSKILHPADKSCRTIFGDAAAATLVSADGGFATIGEFDLGTDGRGAEHLAFKNTRVLNRNALDAATVEAQGSHPEDDYFHMNGTAVFNFTSESVPKLIQNTLDKNGVGFDDIDLFIFHQANQFMLNHLRKKLKIPEEKFYLFLERSGNTTSSTIPIAIKEAMADGSLKAGHKVLIAGFGVGFSWGATVLQL